MLFRVHLATPMPRPGRPEPHSRTHARAAHVVRDLTPHHGNRPPGHAFRRHRAETVRKASCNNRNRCPVRRPGRAWPWPVPASHGRRSNVQAQFPRREIARRIFTPTPRPGPGPSAVRDTAGKIQPTEIQRNQSGRKTPSQEARNPQRKKRIPPSSTRLSRDERVFRSILEHASTGCVLLEQLCLPYAEAGHAPPRRFRRSPTVTSGQRGGVRGGAPVAGRDCLWEAGAGRRCLGERSGLREARHRRRGGTGRRGSCPGTRPGRRRPRR